MGYSAVTVRVEGAMYSERQKCICGDFAELKFITKIGRVNSTLVTVDKVPVYTC